MKKNVRKNANTSQKNRNCPQKKKNFAKNTEFLKLMQNFSKKLQKFIKKDLILRIHGHFQRGIYPRAQLTQNINIDLRTIRRHQIFHKF